MIKLIFVLYLLASVLSYVVDNQYLKQLKRFNHNLIDSIIEKFTNFKNNYEKPNRYLDSRDESQK